METSQLICSANQLTGFYMMATFTFNELKISQAIREKYTQLFAGLFMFNPFMTNVPILYLL